MLNKCDELRPANFPFERVFISLFEQIVLIGFLKPAILLTGREKIDLAHRGRRT